MRPFNSSTTGSTDLRDTDVQPPNMTSTLSWVNSWRAFSANNGQSEAGSTTIGSSCLPNTPPLALISSMVMRAVSFNEVSEMAIVPDKECKIPTLMVSPSAAGVVVVSAVSVFVAVELVSALVSAGFWQPIRLKLPTTATASRDKRDVSFESIR